MAKNITKVPNGPLIKKKGPYAGSTLKTGGVIKKAQTGTTLTPQQKRAQMDSIANIKRQEIVRKKDSILNRNAIARGMTREQVRAQQEKDKKKPDAVKEDLTDCSKRTDKTGSCTTGNTGGGQSTKDNKRNGGNIMKKAQNGVKATKDSTAYFQKKAKENFEKASNRYGYANPEIRKKASEYTDKAIQAQKDELRQSNKGKPGYDSNGYPLKKKAKSGAMIKRADGSYSKRGLWDNIRANKGSGKKPTAAMLKQEKKIKAKK